MIPAGGWWAHGAESGGTGHHESECQSLSRVADGDSIATALVWGWWQGRLRKDLAVAQPAVNCYQLAVSRSALAALQTLTAACSGQSPILAGSCYY